MYVEDWQKKPLYRTPDHKDPLDPELRDIDKQNLWNIPFDRVECKCIICLKYHKYHTRVLYI